MEAVSTERTRRAGLVGAMLAACAMVIGALIAPVPAQAITWNPAICTGFAGCAAQGYGSAGYDKVYKTSYWYMTAGHNCTNYVAYRLIQRGVPRFIRSNGNAYNWGAEARAAGYTVDKGTPRVGDVAWWDRAAIGGSGLGHVAYVESVNAAAGTFTVSEDNYSGDFNWRTYRTSEVSGFIRFSVPAGTLLASTPTLGGTAEVGSTLTAIPGTWGPAPVTLAYQWHRNGVAIPGATRAEYTVAAVDAGQGISVTVTGSRTGYPSVAKTSVVAAGWRYARG